MFVHADDPADVLATLAEIFNGPVERHVIEVRGASVEVLRNPDRTGAPEQDFLYWPVLVEIESNGTLAVLDLTAEILTHLWDRGFPTVAACDYDDELPWQGGIGRIDR